VRVRAWGHDAGAGQDVEDRAQDSFIELGVRHRKRLEGTRLWLRTGFATRLEEEGPPLYRLEGRAYWISPAPSLAWRNDVQGVLQDTLEDTAWSLSVRSQLGHRLEIDPGVLSLRSTLGFGLREQSLDDFGVAPPEDVSFQVFSTYYEDHDRWLDGRLELQWWPLLDVMAYAGGAVRTNRSLDPGDPDRLSARAGARGMVGALGWSLELEHLTRLADADRDRDEEELRLEASIDTILWPGPRHAWTFGARGLYVAETGEVGLGLELGWQLSPRRELMDHHPGERRFQGQRRWFYGYD
jgi:hypothetical protein